MKAIGIFVVIGWIFRVAFLLILAFVGFGALAFGLNNPEPPNTDKAQYAIQTYSTDGQMIPRRIYFTNEIVFQDNLPTVTDYWWFDGKNYQHVGKERTFTETVKVVRRAQ